MMTFGRLTDAALAKVRLFLCIIGLHDVSAPLDDLFRDRASGLVARHCPRCGRSYCV